MTLSSERIDLGKRLTTALTRFHKTKRITPGNLAQLETLGLLAPDLFDHGIYKLTADGRAQLGMTDADA